MPGGDAASRSTLGVRRRSSSMAAPSAASPARPPPAHGHHNGRAKEGAGFAGGEAAETGSAGTDCGRGTLSGVAAGTASGTAGSAGGGAAFGVRPEIGAGAVVDARAGLRVLGNGCLLSRGAGCDVTTGAGSIGGAGTLRGGIGIPARSSSGPAGARVGVGVAVGCGSEKPPGWFCAASGANHASAAAAQTIRRAGVRIMVRCGS